MKGTKRLSGVIVSVEPRTFGERNLLKVTIRMETGRPAWIYLHDRDAEWIRWKDLLERGNVLAGLEVEAEPTRISRTSMPELIDRSKDPDSWGIRSDPNQRELL